MYIYMACNCVYTDLKNTSCVNCTNVSSASAKAAINQKRIWGQVRAASSIYTMNLSASTSAAAILANGKNANWNQMSDRVVASKQPVLIPTHGNSLRSTLTSNKPGASTPGGKGVDVKHDSYARFLNRKKASVVKTQTNNIASKPLYGNKTKQTGLLANSINCCS